MAADRKDDRKPDAATPEDAKPGTKPVTPAAPQLSDRDEAAPGTPGTAENIDPKTGERFTEGIGGA